MPYFRQGAIIHTDIRPLPCSMRMARKAVRCCEPTVTEACGLQEESPTERSTCIARENWCGSRRIAARASGPANRRIGPGFGINGVTFIDRSDDGIVKLHQATAAAESHVVIG